MCPGEHLYRNKKYLANIVVHLLISLVRQLRLIVWKIRLIIMMLGLIFADMTYFVNFSIKLCGVIFIPEMNIVTESLNTALEY